MRCLVTGGFGFLGAHVLERLACRGDEAAALGRGTAGPSRGWETFACDLADDLSGAQRILKRFQPDAILHLAGCIRSPAGPAEVLRNNTASTLNILEACRQACPDAHLLAVSSSAVYGQGKPPGRPLTERRPLAPRTVYGVSKAAVESLALQYWRSYRLAVTLVRPFNLTGPGQKESFVVSGLARQLCLIDAGRQEPWISTGNLNTVRDFTDVRDASEALATLSRSPQPGKIFNLCSGTGRSIATVIERLKALSCVEFSVRQRPELVRGQEEIATQIGDPTLLRETTGWQPRYRFDQTLQDLLRDWQARLGIA